MLFENNNGYLDMLFNFNMPSSMNDMESYDHSEMEKFLRGNMFDNEYKPYKNMTYVNPKVKSEREKELLEIMKSSFAIIDYNLYLDVHPEDTSILNKYKACADKLDKQIKDYESKYGPLSIKSADYKTYKWLDSPWPWDKEDSKYV